MEREAKALVAEAMKDDAKAEKPKEEIKEFVDEFAEGDNNIYVDELSDDEVAASRNDG